MSGEEYKSWISSSCSRHLSRAIALSLVAPDTFNSPYKLYTKKKKWSRYRPGVAQRVCRVTALLFYDRGTRRGWVVSSTPRPHFTHGKDPVPIVQEAGLAPGLGWTGKKSRPHQDSIPGCPARCQSLYRLSYRAHTNYILLLEMKDTRTYTSSPLCSLYIPGVKTTFVTGSHFYRTYR